MKELIEKLNAVKAEAPGASFNWPMAVDRCIEVIRSHTPTPNADTAVTTIGDKNTTDNGESIGCEKRDRTAVQNAEQKGEICDNDLIVIMTNAFRDSLGWQQQTVDIEQNAVEAAAKGMRVVLNAIRPYLRTTEPVSIAIAAEAIAKWREEGGSKNEHLAEACAEAWGLKHGE